MQKAWRAHTRAHTQANSVLQNGFLKVCVSFPPGGPDLLRDSQEGLEGQGLFYWFVRVRILDEVQVKTLHVKHCVCAVPLPTHLGASPPRPE